MRRREFNPIIVQKYGGACLETPAKIRAVASSLADLHSRGHRVVAIVSAMGIAQTWSAPSQLRPFVELGGVSIGSDSVLDEAGNTCGKKSKLLRCAPKGLDELLLNRSRLPVV